MAMPLHGFGEKGTLIPDDLFGFEYPDEGYRFFAVEIDRNTESIERTNFTYNTIGKKVAGYVRAINERTFKHWWGIPNLSILMVTTNATHAGNMIDHIKNQGERLDRFAITVEPSFTSNWRVPKALLSHLLDEPWQTPSGHKEITKA